MLKRPIASLCSPFSPEPLVFAQELRATLTGRINDPSGLAVAGAGIVATKADTNSRFDIVSGADGFYTLPLLPPGTYDLSVEAKGFTLGIKAAFPADGEVSYLNNNPGPGEPVSASDRPNRLILDETYDLPFGKGRRFPGQAHCSPKACREVGP